jgi:hypothetical protein
MKRMLIAGFLGLVMASLGRAHFPFIVPDTDGTSAKLVFSDDLNPDMNVNVEKIANTKLTLRDSNGKEATLDHKKGDSCYLVNLPGTGNRMVYGVTDYGVLQKGDTKPFKLVYYPKAVLGSPAAKEATLGEKCPLEIVALGTFGKLKFQVLAAGKPAVEAEVSVVLPATAKKTMKTDKEGMTTEFQESGRYAVTAKVIESKSGDHAGKKFEEIRSYATLVCDWTK